MSRVPQDEADRLAPHPVLTAYYRSEGEQRRFLDDLFDTTAVSYERVASLMSLGSGAWHRRHALLRAGLVRGMRVLDVAVGTGAVAREALGIVGPTGRVVGVDPSAGMLHETRRSLRLPVVQGLAEGLPFRDASFDFVSMGYALRHVADLRTTFREHYRVLRPGGRLLILEFTRPRRRLAFRLAQLYFGSIVPWAAVIGGRNRHARRLMRYCWDSVRRSVSPELICGAIADAAFEPPRAKADFGVFIEYIAVKSAVAVESGRA
jgi:demethylmenaquinone methyltransferase / 2-methoxy-6-polyprenyl-1,4-benzoquinol methylase